MDRSGGKDRLQEQFSAATATGRPETLELALMQYGAPPGLCNPIVSIVCDVSCIVACTAEWFIADAESAL